MTSWVRRTWDHAPRLPGCPSLAFLYDNRVKEDDSWHDAVNDRRGAELI
jgi:hypothetical protein